jgi:light-regulated signal transduction histidine kinase (bacteriophytochrome)
LTVRDPSLYYPPMKIISSKSLPKKSKALEIIEGLLILFATLLVFNLDVITGDEIAFYIFYIPSIMAVTWYWGNRPGWLMVVLSSILWAIAQKDMSFLPANALVRALTFGVVCMMTGIVRRKEEQLAIISDELARSNRELELFASKAAHDLQSPLATILGFAELLKDKYQDSGDETTKDFTERIIATVNRTILFIKALLNYANVQKPKGLQSPVELEKIVKEVIGDFHFLIIQKKAEVIYDPLPALSIDPGLAGLLFQNLIGNAMKYCETEPRIRISAVQKGKEWLFSVQDNGIGVPETLRERIFLMFEKLVTRQKYPGSGIGLATCQKIVERYGGRIWVESSSRSAADVQGGAAGESGVGSTFFFTLPAV